MAQASDIDALFKLPLSEFTTARNSLASRLRKEGKTSEAERVKAMPKPSATAWAVNQLFWRQPKDFDRLFAIGEKVRKAQTGKPANLRVLIEERRKMIVLGIIHPSYKALFPEHVAAYERQFEGDA